MYHTSHNYSTKSLQVQSPYYYLSHHLNLSQSLTVHSNLYLALCFSYIYSENFIFWKSINNVHMDPGSGPKLIYILASINKSKYFRKRHTIQQTSMPETLLYSHCYPTFVQAFFQTDLEGLITMVLRGLLLFSFKYEWYWNFI